MANPAENVKEKLSQNVGDTNPNDSNSIPTLSELFLGSNRTRLEADARSVTSNDDPAPSETANDDTASVMSIEYKQAQEFRQQRELEIDDAVETTPVQSPSHQSRTLDNLSVHLNALQNELAAERNLRKQAEEQEKKRSEEFKLMCENFERIKNDLLNRMNDMSRTMSATTATAEKAQATANTALNTRVTQAQVDARIRAHAGRR